MDSLRRFLMHLRYADAIMVKSNALHEYRRYHIIQARTECLMIMDEMEYIAKVYPVNMKKYLPVIDCIHYEIKLLNRLEKQIMINGERNKMKISKPNALQLQKYQNLEVEATRLIFQIRSMII